MLLKSLFYFLLAGLCEIGGGYLVWLGLLGGMILFLYAIIPTLQSASFGRVYAAYGGVFVFLSLLWGWKVDGVNPDRFDWLGSSIVIAGVLVIMYAP